VANDYWKTATAAELQLLQAKYPEAAALYRAAVVIAPGDTGSHDSRSFLLCLDLAVARPTGSAELNGE
jgi:hypothetical protein